MFFLLTFIRQNKIILSIINLSLSPWIGELQEKLPHKTLPGTLDSMALLSEENLYKRKNLEKESSTRLGELKEEIGDL